MAYKRIRLLKYVAGLSTKQALCQLLSGAASDSITDEIRSDKYVMGWTGNLATSPTLTADSTMYMEGFFERQYSVNHPNLVSNGYNLYVKPTDSDVNDVIQYGDYAFNLTNATTMGTQYASTVQPVTADWQLDKHELVTYVPGTTSAEIQHIINRINFNITPESPDIVYGMLSGSTLIMYVPDVLTRGTTVYSLSSGLIDSLPFNYILEQPLNYSLNFGSVNTAYGGLVSGSVTSGDALYFVYSVNATLPSPYVYSPDTNAPQDNIIYYNPFKCKNMYNYNWNTEVTLPDILYGARNYNHIGRTQNQMWLSYNYYREDPSIVDDFELVERIYGLYKFTPYDGHKSNVYSIRIYNSGLNEGITDTSVRGEIQNIVEKAMLKSIKKISPAGTQLWMLDWSGN